MPKFRINIFVSFKKKRPVVYFRSVCLQCTTDVYSLVSDASRASRVAVSLLTS